MRGMRGGALRRGNESKNLCFAESDAVGEAKRLYPIILGEEVVRNDQLIPGGKSHLQVKALPSSRHKINGPQIGESHHVLADPIGFIVSDGLDRTTPDNHIGVISLTTDKSVIPRAGDEAVTPSPTMEDIMTSATIKDVITISPMKRVVAIPSCQGIVLDTPIEEIMAVKPFDSIGHVIEATERVIACRGPTDHDAVAKMAIPPENTVGELEGLNAVGL